MYNFSVCRFCHSNVCVWSVDTRVYTQSTLFILTTLSTAVLSSLHSGGVVHSPSLVPSAREKRRSAWYTLFAHAFSLPRTAKMKSTVTHCWCCFLGLSVRGNVFPSLYSLENPRGMRSRISLVCLGHAGVYSVLLACTQLW